MRKSILVYPALAASLFFFVACSNAPAETQLLPGNAQLVISIDPGYAAQKLTAAGMPLDSLLDKVFLRDSIGPEQKALLQKIRAGGGIQWKGKWHWALSKQIQDSIPITQYNVVGSISDPALFEKTLQSDSLLGKNIQSGKGFKYVFTDRYSVLAWTDKYLLTTAWDYAIKPYYDTLAGKFIIPAKKDLRPQLLTQTAALLSQNKSASLASQKGFAEMFKVPAEGYMYTNSSQYSQLLGNLPLPLPKVEELLANNYTTATLQFETGKILATVTTHTNPLLSSVFKKHAGPIVALDQLKVPVGYQLNGFYSANFEPQILETLLKELEVDQLAESFLEKQGLKTAVLTQAFKGGFHLAMADSTGSSKTKFLMALPLADTAKLHALLAPLVQKGFLVGNTTGWESGNLLKGLSVFVHQNQQWLVMGNDLLWNKQFLQGQGNNSIPTDVQAAFKGKSTAGWFNLNRELMSKKGDSSQSMGRAATAAVFKDIRVYSENYSNGKITGHWEINLWDQQTTSMAKILSLLTEMALNKHQDWQMAALEEKVMPLVLPGVIRSN